MSARRDLSDVALRARPRWGRRGPVVALVVAGLALVGAGCGSSSDKSSTTGGGGGSTASTAAASAPAAARDVTVCFDGASPPQEYYDDAHSPAGSEVELLTALGKAENLKFSYHQVQFNGLIPALLSKQCDLVSAGLFVKPERLKVINFVLNSINGQSLMVAKGKNADITGYNDTMAGKAIGMPAGYATIPIVQKECEKIASGGKKACHIVQFGNVPDTYESLKTNKVDTVIDSTTSVGYFAANHSDTFALVDSPPVLPSKVGWGIRKDDATLQTAVQKGMDQLYANGEACKILTKWKIGTTALPPNKC